MGKIVVTPGAGAGVCRATVIEFARNGCDVAPFSRGPERLESAASEACRFGVRALSIPADAADAGAVEAAATRVEQEFGLCHDNAWKVGGVIFPSMVLASVGTGLGPLLAQPGRVDVSSLHHGCVLFALPVLAVPLVIRRRRQEHAACGRLRSDRP